MAVITNCRGGGAMTLTRIGVFAGKLVERVSILFGSRRASARVLNQWARLGGVWGFV